MKTKLKTFDATDGRTDTLYHNEIRDEISLNTTP